MNDNDLLWDVQSRTSLLKTVVFEVEGRHSKSATGIEGDYIALKGRRWVVTIPVTGDSVVLVRQWRHGLEGLTVEFPGGVVENDEDPIEGAARELLEETGFKAGKMTYLGTCNPNPAIFANSIVFCLAEDLVQTGETHLDHDELLTTMTLPLKEVIDNFAKGEYINAFMGTAITLYLRHIGKI